MRPYVVFALALALGTGAFPAVVRAQAQAQPSPEPRPSPTASPSAPQPVPTPSAPLPTPGPGGVLVVPSATATPPVNLLNALLGGSGGAAPQTYGAFVHGAQRIPGLIALIRKDDDIYFDLTEDQLERTYIIAPQLASGFGGAIYAGRAYDPFLVRFKRVGKRILWLSPNPNFQRPRTSAAEASLSISVADSIIASSNIVAEDKENKRLVIAPALFLTDFEGIGRELGGTGAPSLPTLFLLGARPSFSLDTSRSFYSSTKAFPLNDEFVVTLTFSGSGNALRAVTDPRGTPIRMHYSIIELPPSSGYVPRRADDRVGYFITAQKRLGDDAEASPFVRYIDRWNLRKGPIVFTLTNEIPPQYRETVKRGILAWNEAFAAAGHPNAIVVHDPPTDPNFDPDDIRYTTVRWLLSDRNDFVASSPHISNPLTGEIIRASLVIEGESLRTIKRGYLDEVRPAQRGSYARSAFGGADESEAEDAFDQSFQTAASENAALGSLDLKLGGRLNPQTSEQYARDYLLYVVMHESGHALGLRHNFAASTAFTTAQLASPAFTHAHGISASVMDYLPVNLAQHNRAQPQYFQTAVGAYDRWAIQYGYADVSPSQLSAIANRSTQPELRYATDEDELSAINIDPRVAAFDLSSDPLAYHRAEFDLLDGLMAKLDRTYPRDDRSYYEERQTFITLAQDYLRSAQLAARYVGGLYTSTAHRGQPGGGPPFAAIDRATQKRAFDLIGRYVLSSHALRLSPALLNDLGPDRFHGWGSDGLGNRPDFPVTDFVQIVQDGVLYQMFTPTRLARLADEQLKTAPGTTMSLADLFDWSSAAVWDDLGSHASIAPLHRELQRRYTDLLGTIALLPASAIEQLSMPYETQALARYQLAHLEPRLHAALAGRGLDSATRAHLENVAARVHSVLGAQSIRPN